MKKKPSATVVVGSYRLKVNARESRPANRKRDYAILLGIELVLLQKGDSKEVWRLTGLGATSYRQGQKGAHRYWNICGDLLLDAMYTSFPQGFSFDAKTASLLRRRLFKEADRMNFYMVIRETAEELLRQAYHVPSRKVSKLKTRSHVSSSGDVVSIFFRCILSSCVISFISV